MKRIKRKAPWLIALVLIVMAAAVAFVKSASADTGAGSHNVHLVAVSGHSVQVGWRGVGPNVPDEVIIYNPSTLQLVKHSTLEAGHSDNRVVDFGTGLEGQALAFKVAFSVDGISTGWSQPVLFYANVAAGAQGPKGDIGPAGPAGPSGVVSVGTHTMIDAPQLVHTGGSFTSQEQLAGSVDLQPGTYLVTLNAKVAWASGNDVFPQFFAYDGVPASDFSNDLFNVGNGALAQGNASIDSYYSGTAQVTVAAPETLNEYVFGYDGDRGAGTYTLEDLTLTVTQLQVGAA